MEVFVLAIPVVMIVVVVLVGLRGSRGSRREGRRVNEALKRYVSKETVEGDAERGQREGVA